MTSIWKPFAAFLVIGLLSFGVYAIPAQADGPSAHAGKNVIRIVEHPGYFETQGSVFKISPGSYTFQVENRAGKDAGFVLAREGADPHVILVKNGEHGSLTVDLSKGSYSYYCPIIPTAKYPLLVE